MTYSTHSMKSSYLQTPRTMDEAVWHPWGAAIEVQTPAKGHVYDVVVYLLSFAVACTTIYILVAK